jgi:hypothetical protein
MIDSNGTRWPSLFSVEMVDEGAVEHSGVVDEAALGVVLGFLAARGERGDAARP